MKHKKEENGINKGNNKWNRRNSKNSNLKQVEENFGINRGAEKLSWKSWGKLVSMQNLKKA